MYRLNTLKRIIDIFSRKTIVGNRTVNNWSFIAPKAIVKKDCIGYPTIEDLSVTDVINDKAIAIILDESGNYFEILHFTREYGDVGSKCIYIPELHLKVRATRVWIAKEDLQVISPFSLSIRDDSSKLEVKFTYFAFNSYGNIDCMVYHHPCPSFESFKKKYYSNSKVIDNKLSTLIKSSN